MTSSELPRGIRNNNPGNLRRACAPDFKSETVDGFARFRNPHDGLINLAYCLDRMYRMHLKRTAFDLVMMYAPPSENDSMNYVKVFASYLRITPGAEKSFDLRLGEQWRMLDAMRGVIHIENGPPPSRLSVGGEWFKPSELWDAIDAMHIC